MNRDGNAAALPWLGAPVALAGFVLFLAPSTAWFDSGELAAAAVQLGVPHPTGFPLFNLSGHLLTLLPIGPLALRVHFVGATAAVLAVWLWLACLHRGERPLADLPGWAAAMCAAAAIGLPLLGPAPLQHVRAAEVYPLTWLVAVGGLAIWQRADGRQRLPALVALCGLATLIHVEAVLICGALTALALWESRKGRGLAQLPLVIGMLAAALAVAGLAYLPLAALRLPDLNWGDVRSVKALWRHLSAATIREAFADQIGAPALADTLAMLGLQLRDNVSWLAPPALLGAALSWRNQRRAMVATVMVLGIDLGYSVWLNPMGLRDQQVGLLLYVGLGTLAVRGLLGGARMAVAAAGRGRRIVGAFAPLVVVALCCQGAATALERSPPVDLAAGGRMADALLADVPPGALLLTSGDHAGSACAWLQTAEGARPDSPCVPVIFSRDERMLELLALRTGEASFGRAAEQARAGAPASALLAAWMRPIAAARPLRWELGLAAEERLLQGHLRAGFPWHSVIAELTDPALDRRAVAEALAAMVDACRGAPAGACRPGAPLSTWLAHHANVLAARLMVAGDPGATALLHAAAQWAPDEPKVLNNLAVHLMATGRAAAALAHCERALARQPDYRRVHRTAARAAMLLGRGALAVSHVKAYLAGALPTGEQRRWLRGLQRLAPDVHSKTTLGQLLGPDEGGLPTEGSPDPPP